MTSLTGRGSAVAAGTRIATALPCRVIVTLSPRATRPKSSGNRVVASSTPTVVTPASNQTQVTLSLDENGRAVESPESDTSPGSVSAQAASSGCSLA